MRHNRRAVMTEQYKLYMKKHIFNGRYFVRNLQIFMCVVVVTALVIGGFMLGNSDSEGTVADDKSVSVKDALFASSEAKTERTIQDSEEQTENPSKDTEQPAKEDSEQVNSEKSEQITTEAVVVEASTETETPEVKTEEKSKFSDRCIADVEETLNIRKAPDKESEFVGSMNNGAIAKVLGTEGEWTKIKSGDVEGYVLSEYVKTGESAEEFAKDYVTLQGTALEDGVNIRSEKSTDSDILKVLDKDDTITVLENTDKNDKEEQTDEIIVSVSQDSSVAGITEAVTQAVNAETEKSEETEQDITWLPVMLEGGETGYVSAELVDVDELYALAVSAEELERQAAEKEAARKAAEEEAARQAAAAAAGQEQSSGGNQSSDDDYKGATTTPVTATESGDCLGTFTITAYCGCKKCSGGSNKTASGTTPTEGRTIAADTSILPYGTQVVIDGIVYTVEDCGSGVNGNHIDIFFATHKKAMAFGRKTLKVYKY